MRPWASPLPPSSSLVSRHHVPSAIVVNIANGEALGPHSLHEVDLHRWQLRGRLSVGHEGDPTHFEGRVLRRGVTVQSQAEVGLAAMAAVIDEHPQPRVADLPFFNRRLEVLLSGLSECEHTHLLRSPDLPSCYPAGTAS